MDPGAAVRDGCDLVDWLDEFSSNRSRLFSIIDFLCFFEGQSTDYGLHFFLEAVEFSASASETVSVSPDELVS